MSENTASPATRLTVQPDATGRLLLLLPAPEGSGTVEILLGQQKGAMLRLASLAYLQAGYSDTAIEWAQWALNDAPHEPANYVHLSTIHMRLGDTAKAESLLAEALESLPQATALLRQRGSVALQRGDMDEAFNWARHAAEVAPFDAGLQINLANLLVQAGEFDEARDILLRLLDQQPGLTAALRLLSVVSQRLGD
ncbi:hypothetical protein D9599_30265, partial [Roseomonas sp. KE2513]|uniref:tetratricopeptide repeat protein n=1 Tax=Roseomonas sp. KE2513 TaxID=2479202 RepID=UPI0018DFD464